MILKAEISGSPIREHPEKGLPITRAADESAVPVKKFLRFIF
jgi:hypothetical protein